MGLLDSIIDSVQFSSVAQLCLTLRDPMNHSVPGLTNSRSSLRLTSIESVMPYNHLILCRPLLLLPSIFPSIRVFSNESALCIKWPKYWSFSLSISASNEYSGLISFKIGKIELLAVQGTQESFLAPKFKSINYLVLSLIYGPTLTSIHDY